MNDDGWKPLLRPGIKVQVLEGEAVLLDRENERVHQLDAVGTHMLQLCDGQRPLLEIVEALLPHYEVDEQRLRQDTLELLKRLQALGVLT